MSDNLISFTVSNTNPLTPLYFETWLDNQLIFSGNIAQDQKINYTFPDDEKECYLRFILKDKKPEHTQLNSQGEIIQDACVVISNLALNEINIQDLLPTCAEYRHNFNSTGPDTVENFFNAMGCNGTVELKFTMPVYIWLLEHL